MQREVLLQWKERKCEDLHFTSVFCSACLCRCLVDKDWKVKEAI